jgi:NAD(P)-dependent dehydrogenase (short-subunit alcohol dehydrogenase family)
MKFDFSHKTILVTGATSGIGLDLVKTLTNLNANLIILYRDEEKFKSLFNHSDVKILTSIKVDLENTLSIFPSLEIIKKLNTKIDGFVHCAGIANPRPIQLMNHDYYTKMFSVNLFSFFEIIRFLTKYNFLSSVSSIVAISSIQAEYGDKAKAVYAASKGAINSSIKSFAKELASRGTRINSVVPGFIKTEMYEDWIKSVGEDKINDYIKHHQYLGLGSTYDVINAIIFLLSEYSRFITGTNLIVDGGYLS